ncbi:hypothetical protein F4V43_01605 [Paenibacillus spiritus]|uniref:Uncharacterized protein n=1 Tax=Paenibacillus spiritus TaxID=2496557 RepID=A0A5J5GHM7_9BACL|nr:hypothetical protein [Paenibacillus spiritus]KAA9007208.1 hypothetical protein F4V43_01605 [Paenibacillus spiritus]
MNKNTNNDHNLDRFTSPYYNHRFPDPQEKEVINYSTCAGCGETVTTLDVINRDILDIYGMCVHDDRECIKKAVEARVITLDDIMQF